MKPTTKKLTLIAGAVILGSVAVMISPPWNTARADSGPSPQIWVHESCSSMDVGVEGSGYFHLPVEVQNQQTVKFTSDKLKSGHGYDTYSLDETTGDHHIEFGSSNQIACLLVYENSNKTCSSSVVYTTGSCDWNAIAAMTGSQNAG